MEMKLKNILILWKLLRNFLTPSSFLSVPRVVTKAKGWKYVHAALIKWTAFWKKVVWCLWLTIKLISAYFYFPKVSYFLRSILFEIFLMPNETNVEYKQINKFSYFWRCSISFLLNQLDQCKVCLCAGKHSEFILTFKF